ncbi:MAG: hypothetical protein LKJ17_07355 [Oscillospiraceae bacterium]|nr:hypothetical protein [Oscillospiraceae bacterium]
MKKILSFFMAIVLSCSLVTTAFAAESSDTTNKNANVQIIGKYDGPLSNVMKSSRTALSSNLVNVRVNSYATYDKNDGITVYVKLYTPWYEFADPEFTSMSGSASVNLRNDTTTKYFYESEDGSNTISTDIDTGVTGNSGDEGTVSVSGVATANNALAGGGAFAISYDIEIP